MSESTTSLTGESHADATDTDASVLANYPHSRAAWVVTKVDYLPSTITTTSHPNGLPCPPTQPRCDREGFQVGE